MRLRSWAFVARHGLRSQLIRQANSLVDLGVDLLLVVVILGERRMNLRQRKVRVRFVNLRRRQVITNVGDDLGNPRVRSGHAGHALVV